jgi:sec-independent protein translocase protein TatA
LSSYAACLISDFFKRNKIELEISGEFNGVFGKFDSQKNRPIPGSTEKSKTTDHAYMMKIEAMSIYFLISMPGGSEWILIIVAVLIMFGGKKLPEFMKGLGKGMREFNEAKNNVSREFENGMNEPEKPVTKTVI